MTISTYRVTVFFIKQARKVMTKVRSYNVDNEQYAWFNQTDGTTYYFKQKKISEIWVEVESPTANT